MLPRVGKSTLKVLEAQEDRDRDSLIRILSNSDLSVETVHEIRYEISKIKAEITKFEVSNKALAEWYLRNGSYNREKEVRSNRVKLIYIESRAAVHALNEKLQELSVETESTIGSGSHAAESCVEPSNELLEDQTANEDVQAGQLLVHANEKADNLSVASLAALPRNSQVEPPVVAPLSLELGEGLRPQEAVDPLNKRYEGAMALPSVSKEENLDVLGVYDPRNVHKYTPGCPEMPNSRGSLRFNSLPYSTDICTSKGAVPKIKKPPLTSFRETQQVENVFKWIKDSDEYLDSNRLAGKNTDSYHKPSELEGCRVDPA